MVSKTLKDHRAAKKAAQDLTERTMSIYGRPPMSANYARVIQRQKAAANRSNHSALHAASTSRPRRSNRPTVHVPAATSRRKTSTKPTARSAKQYLTAKTRSLNERAHARTAKRKNTSRTFSWSERTLIGMISISAICISIALLIDFSFNPERDAEHALEQLAKDYYTEYLYPNTIRNQTSDPSKVLASYTEQGYPTVRLRQLLHYNDDAKIEMKKYFDNQYYNCNTNSTTLRYFPVEPYGPKDYTVTYSYDCQDLREDSAQAQKSTESIRAIEK